PPIPGPDRTCLVVCSAPAPPTCISTLIITILIRIWREVTRVGPASRGGFRPAARGAPGGRLRQVGPQGSGDLSRGGELLRRERVHEQLADGFQVGVRGGPERLGAGGCQHDVRAPAVSGALLAPDQVPALHPGEVVGQ